MAPKKPPKIVSRWLPLTDTATIMQSLTVPGLDDLSVRPEDMTLTDIECAIKFVEQSNITLQVENAVLERYLQRMDPNLIAKMDQILEAAAVAVMKAERAAQLGAAVSTMSMGPGSRKADEESDSSTPRTATSGVTASHTFISKLTNISLLDKGPKVQSPQKIEIINREIDDLKGALEKYKEKSRNYHYLMRCRTEELTLRLEEINEARDHFEQRIVIDAVDPITGKVPGEKFVRYVEVRLTHMDGQLEKLRMKTCSIKIQLGRIQQRLAQKAELGEVLHAVDFEQLEIENKTARDKLDETVSNLIEVKKINARYGNMINYSRKKLQEQVNKLEKLHENVDEKEKNIKFMLANQELVNVDVEKAAKDVDKITHLIKTYTVPDVIEYVQQKAQLHELKKAVKAWERKNKLEEMAMATRMRKMKKEKKSGMSARFIEVTGTPKCIDVPLGF